MIDVKEKEMKIDCLLGFGDDVLFTLVFLL